MKIFKTEYILCFGLLFTLACTQDFEEINTNPTAPNQVEPSLLLRQVLWNSAEEMSYEGFVAGNLLGQYFTAIDFNLFDRHSLTEPQFGGNPWPVLYRNLRDNEILLQLALENPTQAVYEGPARILKAYLAATLTDIYGDVPYSEALQGRAGITRPSYDQQAEIYLGQNGILENLQQAKSAIKAYSGAQQLQGDIIYNGDLEGWLRLANSLLIKYSIRIAQKQSPNSLLQSLFEEDDFIQSNTQNASFDFSAGQPNNFRMANLRTGDFNLFVMSETAADILQELEDPRISVFFRPAENLNGNYQGLLNGPDASNLSISVADYSLTGSIFREETERLDGTYMSAWETYFFLAEAAQKGWIEADAKALYEQAVNLAFDYWGAALPSTYLSNGPAAFKENDQAALEQILTQKWIANIINGYEGWVEYRRTGYPKLKTISASLNANLIPVRMPYPTDEAALNTSHFEQAASSTNNNSINFPVWWDQN